MSASRQQAEKRGRRAETYAALYLRLIGHRILAQRFRCKAGEIDLIARRGRTLLFIEVKQRSREAHARDMVSYESEQRIQDAAEIWLNAHPGFLDQTYDFRYDIITVIGRWRLRHERDVFRGW